MEDGIAEAGGGSGDIFVVKALTGNPPSSPSATFAEMVEAIKAGKTLVLRYLNMPEEYGNQFDVYQFISYYDYGATSSSSKIIFSRVWIDAPSIKVSEIAVNALDEWSISSN